MSKDLNNQIADTDRPVALAYGSQSSNASIVLVCEHASNFIPNGLNQLGLTDEATKEHIALDIGALETAKKICDQLLLEKGGIYARLVYSNVSRLVYDCNRPLECHDAIPETSEIYTIPGNQTLTKQQKQSRAITYYEPFRRLLAAELWQQTSPYMITIHSFTPNYHGKKREVEIGIIHDTDSRLAGALFTAIKEHSDVCVRMNQPYDAADGVTHTLLEHGIKNGIHNVMVEIRNDLISHEKGQNEIAVLLVAAFKQAIFSVTPLRSTDNKTADIINNSPH